MKHIKDYLVESCVKFETKVAIVSKKSELTYGELLDSAQKIAKCIGTQKHIGICFKDPLNFSKSYLAVLMSESTVVLISNNATKYEVKQLISRARCDVVLTDRPDLLNESNKFISIKNIKEINWNYSKSGQKMTYKEVPILLQTSGSTSIPKIIKLSHEALYENAMAHNSHLNIASDNVALITTPVTSSFGHITQFLSQLLIGGQIIFLSSPFTVGDFYQSVERFNVNTTGLVATQLHLLINSSLCKDIESLRYIVCAGGPITNKDIQQIALKMPNTEVLRAYGLTEAGPRVTCCRPGVKSDFGTSGTPLRGVKVKIVREDGANCNEGEAGEIMVRSPAIFNGYYLNKAATSEVLSKGWLKTGDIGFIKGDNLTVIGRNSNKIIVGGFTVYSEEVEEYIMSISGIKDVVVYGIKDSLYGENVAVDCELEEKSELNCDVIKKICQQNLSAYKVPSEINIVEKVKRSETGKLIRKNLGVLSYDK
ncbi:acyl--CoA ligase [Bacillus thuringiensis]|uniref:class I adenylate-forming enzyme family protein n=1 Tax=Bacillus thuringiensis TaxID=1428 RepID=UPI00333B3674